MDYKIKVVLLGDTAVGKTSIVQRFVNNRFDAQCKTSTGAGFICKTIKIPNTSTRVSFKIWDTAGQERYHSMAAMYYQDAGAAIVVYDTTNLESFKGTEVWIKELKENGPEDIEILLLGNKSDLVQNEMVSIDEAKRYSDQIGADFIIASAKENINIIEAFEHIALKIIKIPTNDVHTKRPETETVKLNEKTSKQKSKNCC